MMKEKWTWVVVVLLVVGWTTTTAMASASWSNVATAIDNYQDVTDCIFLAGNNSTGPAFTHYKGTALTSLTSRMSVASASKMVAASIIYRLQEEGHLNVDDLVSSHLSFWTKTPSDPRSSVTIRQLLSFTGGFKADDDCCGNSAFTVQTCAQQIYNGATGSNFNAPSGSTFYYDCNNLQIAGAVAEQATGQSWATLFGTYWKTPLGISSSLTTWTPLANPNIAGGLFCSTQEYLNFLLALFGNTFFANPATEAVFFDDNTPSDSVTIQYSPITIAAPPQVWHYCQGNWLECEKKSFDAACAARKVNSSPGKFGFYPRWDRANNYWSIVARWQTTGMFGAVQSVQMFQLIESNVTALLTQTVSSSTTQGSGSSTNPTTQTSSSLTSSAALISISCFFALIITLCLF